MRRRKVGPLQQHLSCSNIVEAYSNRSENVKPVRPGDLATYQPSTGGEWLNADG